MISNAIDFIFSKDYLNSIFVQSNLSLISTKQKTKMSSAEHVWFLLVDSSGGPFEDTRADKVSLPSSSDVADFRDAVHVKYDKPGYLKDIPAGVLTVYRDAAHFSARETEGPLEEDSELGVMGKSKKDALIVLVPSPSPSGMCRAFVSNTA